jgi:leucyl-tRNA synthetase
MAEEKEIDFQHAKNSENFGAPKIIDFKGIEKKWQQKWEKEKCFEVKEDLKKKKFYCLEMFPYPSGEGLHMGHALNYTIGDIYARFKRMNGFNVLYPMGYDAFGLPAENAAIKAGQHPREYTKKSMANFEKQQRELGLSYSWSRIVKTCEPEYYRWNQYFFLKFFENGLVYRKKAAVNWCPKCNTVLANEQVHGGKCWRHEDTNVEIKHLEQWFVKTTDYCDELLDEIDSLQWPERIKIMQKNWIGKSFGTEIDFEINGRKWPVFTTRPDTIYGVTFMVVSAQHPKLMELVAEKQKKPVEAFLKKIKSTSEKDMEELEKEGVFTGSYAINPLTKEEVPVYAGNFVVADYGSGMVMAVPAHDQRDFEFAIKYKIPIKEVIIPKFGEPNPKAEFRETISAVIHRKKDNKFLLLKWKEHDWISPIVGGVEAKEDIAKAAEREVLEEAGYKAKFIKKLGGQIESNFFADNKNVWRHRLDQPVLLELINETPSKITKEEQNRHEVIWMTYEEAVQKISHEYNKIGFQRYVQGEGAYTESGILINSKNFDGINSEEAKGKITDLLISKKLGRRTVNYKLRDWLISRQRYWGTPIPIVYCDKCGIVAVPEKDLPVELPEKVEFGKGNPLATNKSFVEAKCPKCNAKARRETDTMDTFFDSSWYFLRYCDNRNSKKPFETDKIRYWMPVDQYIGGAEHACMHLIYARFFTKALRDLGFVNIDEPFIRLFNQGMLHGKDGHVMSKSRGNVVLPEEVSRTYGIDTARLFLVSIASPDKDIEWSDAGVEGSMRFIKRIFSFEPKDGKMPENMESKLNSAIKAVTQQIEGFQYNLAAIELREFFSYLESAPDKKAFETFLKLLSPFCPHMAEEIWHNLGNKSLISTEDWPEADESKINPELEKQEQLNEQLASDIGNIIKLLKEKQGKDAAKIFVYTLPNELKIYDEDALAKKLNLDVEIYAVNDKKKYDPQNKAGKAKPGKPAVYAE